MLSSFLKDNKFIISVRIFTILSFFLLSFNYLLANDTYYKPSETFVIGEFIYNDDYTPTTDDCTISIYSPAGATLVNAVTMTDDATGWHSYSYTAPVTEGKYPTFITCGTLIGGDLLRVDKSFIVKSPEVTDSSIATSVWGSGSRTLTAFGSLAADVWNNTYASVRRLTDGNLTSGTLLTQSYFDASQATVISEIQTTQGLVSALNNISASDVWAAGTRTLTGSVDISSGSVDDIWDSASSGLTASGSIGKLLVDNIDAQISTRGTSNLTAGDVWSSATRTLSTTGVDNISAGVWANAGRTLTNYGNDITATDVWNVLASSLTATGSIGEQLALNVDGPISDVLTEVQNNGTLIAALNDISAADVWAAGTRTLTGSVDISSGSVDAIWDTATSGLSAAGSVGKLVADNLDAQVSSRGTSNLSAADVWSSATRTLSDYSTSSIASAVWANGARTLTNYGNDITAADVWNSLTSSLTTVGSIGELLKDNVDVKMSDVLTEVQNNGALIAALNDISAADVWAAGTRTLTGSVDISSGSVDAIWDTASSGLTASGSIGKLVADNLDAQVSSRGTSNLTASDVWTSATRTLSTAGVDNISAGVWSNAGRTLTNYGNDITATDVWNVLASSVTTVGSIGKQIKDNVDVQMSDVLTEVQNNGTLIAALNDISAADVWAAGTRTLTGSVDISSGSVDDIWDTASSGLTASGSVGKLVVDNLDAQVSSVGGGSLTAADIWSYATRTLSTAGVDDVSAGVWSGATRTLTSYGNDITATDVWNVLSSSLTTVGSIGEQLQTNTDAKISDVLAQSQANAVLIGNLNNISATDVWSYGAKALDAPVDISNASVDSIWDIASINLSTAGSIGELLVDNVDAQISSRGTSNLTAADVWNAATRTLTDYSESSIASAVWANATRTLSNYGNDITAADVWNVLASSLTVVGSIGEQVSTNLDAQVSSIGGTSNWNVRMGNVERVQGGYTYRTKVFILDSSATPTAPFATPLVTLYDSSRNVVVSGIAMNLISTGVYEYTYSVSTSAAQGLWETVVSSQVESGKTIQTNDYWEVSSSPAQVLINSVVATSLSSITGNITITNEGLSGYEYDYEWCVVSDLSNECGGNDDAYYASAAKFINPGEDWNTALSASVTSAGTYYFKLVVYFGTDSSGASRVFTVTGTTSGGGGGGGGGSSSGADTSNGSCQGADFNKNKSVDSIDFSILLYFWKSSYPFSNKCVDINGDKKVDSVDFSIMLFNWGKK